MRAAFSLKSSPVVSAPRVSPVVRAPLQVAAAAPTRNEIRKKRHLRLRQKVNGTAERPRLNVFKSNNNVFVQVIDDVEGHTLAAASTLTPSIRQQTDKKPVELAAAVGSKVAEICLERGITKVCFDRGGYMYHGKILAVATAAREAGLDF